MPDRIIKESIKRSRTLNELSPFEEVCFYRILVTVDDYGRFYRDPQILKSELFPRKPDMTVKSIDDAFETLERVSLIKSYCVGEEKYLQIIQWGKHQRTRATKSKFPDENGNYTTRDSKSRTSDNKCQQMSDNGQQMCPNAKANTKAKANSAREEGPKDGLVLTDEQIREIQRDHSDIIDKMEYIGFEMSQATIDSVIDLYAEHGKEKLLTAMDECKGVNGNKLRYLRKVLANLGTPKPEDSKQYMSDEEERSISARLVFGDEEDL